MTGEKFFVCSVSTCQGKATNYAFCSISCWDAHVPTERHRPDSAGAIERIAPKDPAPLETAHKRVIPSVSPASGAKSKSGEDEVLVVVTKVRKYIADRSGMNTSAEVYDTLTTAIKILCDGAIDEARTQGRKTVMSRDFH
jgi:hypothetical protein